MGNRPIAISLSPNTQSDDVTLAIKTLGIPWLWKRGNAVRQVTAWFEQQFPSCHAYTFNSGRSGMFAILQSFGIGRGDEVIVQAFTCVAAVEPILWVGAKPIYSDIDESAFNLNPKGLEKLITRKTRAIVIQHTFGIPADMDAISLIAKKHQLLLIEDCSHALGATYKGKKVGSFGDAAFFSFGRDKVISSVFGGTAIISMKYEVESTKMKKIHDQLSYPSNWWIVQQLLNPILFALILPLYNIFGIGKMLLLFFQKLRLLSKPIYQEEYYGGKPAIFPKKYPNALAILAMHQLVKLDIFNQQRKAIANYYAKRLNDSNHFNTDAIFLRYPLSTSNPNKLYEYAKQKGIVLGRWYGNVIDPAGVDYVKVGYIIGSCTQAEKTAKHIVNLPTYPTMRQSDATKIVDMLNLLKT